MFFKKFNKQIFKKFNINNVIKSDNLFYAIYPFFNLLKFWGICPFKIVTNKNNSNNIPKLITTKLTLLYCICFVFMLTGK